MIRKQVVTRRRVAHEEFHDRKRLRVERRYPRPPALAVDDGQRAGRKDHGLPRQVLAVARGEGVRPLFVGQVCVALLREQDFAAR
jgi:hypothetical protein